MHMRDRNRQQAVVVVRGTRTRTSTRAPTRARTRGADTDTITAEAMGGVGQRLARRWRCQPTKTLERARPVSLTPCCPRGLCARLPRCGLSRAEAGEGRPLRSPVSQEGGARCSKPRGQGSRPPRLRAFCKAFAASNWPSLLCWVGDGAPGLANCPRAPWYSPYTLSGWSIRVSTRWCPMYVALDAYGLFRLHGYRHPDLGTAPCPPKTPSAIPRQPQGAGALLACVATANGAAVDESPSRCITMAPTRARTGR